MDKPIVPDFDTEKLRRFIRKAWSHSGKKGGTIVEALKSFIRIENVSPDFDPEWFKKSATDDACAVLLEAIEKLKKEWREKGCRTDDVAVEVLGRKPRIVRPDRTVLAPILVVDIPAFGPGENDGTVLLYGHMDKQPGLDRNDWKASPGGPRDAKIIAGKLYGRGGADDGYALFSALSAIMALRHQGTPHSRCVILIEGCEESGSVGLEHYLRELRPRLGEVGLIVCLDSGCDNWERLWLTTSLRGLVNCTVKVSTIAFGLHSGDSSGVVPSSYRILNQLIARLEDPISGVVTPKKLQVKIPAATRKQAKAIAGVLGDQVYTKYNFRKNPDVRPVGNNLAELVLNRTWRAQLSVIGIDGYPPLEQAGNVMHPHTRAKLSFRLPPTLSCKEAARFIKKTLTKNPPYQAHVEYAPESAGNGWAAPVLADWLKNAIEDGSRTFFGQSYLAMGEGGSIPFMSLLGEMFPSAQFLITGVLGPNSNAHGPDEFLHLPCAEQVSMCVALCLARHRQTAGKAAKATPARAKKSSRTP